jgi:uncharacterized protein YprB with RNaseH-like and TPR domain
VVEEHHPLDRPHGCASLALSNPLDLIAEWAGEPRLAHVRPESYAYLDAETTGLARGSGTYAFLVGIARYDQDALHLAQFFMTEPAAEPALLAAVQDFVAPCKALVTFNGKTFDVPLLRTRAIANGQANPVDGLAHLDLLPLARRLWRTRLPSRALSCLETEILDLPRTEDDVPGWMIPSLYFDYLRQGDARPLTRVFYHNTVDILSMAALLSHIAERLTDPIADPEIDALDLLDMGRLFEDLGHIERAAQLYRQALTQGLPAEARRQAVRRWSFLEKRRENLSVAAKLWQDAAQAGLIYAHVELAKMYEHRERDYVQAIYWTEAALRRIGTPGHPRYERLRWADELTHRLDRLKRKGARGQVSDDEAL